MNIEIVPISKIKANKDNPRTINDTQFKKLLESIKKFPQMLEIRPIVVDDNMVVLGGNMRLKACKELGLKKLSIIKASELTEEQKKEFIIKDNLAFGEWDWEILNVDWNSEKLTNWGLDTALENWDDLDYITEEQENPHLKSANNIVVKIAAEFINQKDKIAELIKDVLETNYKGCEIK